MGNIVKAAVVAAMLGKLADHKFAGVSARLRSNLVGYYGDVDRLPTATTVEQKRVATIRKQLALLGQP